jgi:hypothetical protein
MFPEPIRIGISAAAGFCLGALWAWRLIKWAGK